jgi:thiamine biosynthesis lipoprotein
MTFHSFTFEAIGVMNQVTVLDPAILGRAAEIARAEVSALDRACSRFRADSELAALNRCGSQGRVVSPLLFAATKVALKAAESTEGLVDPTVGAALRGLGYDRDFDVVVTSAPRPSFRLVPAGGWKSVRLDPASRWIQVGRASELDLGATAKAFSADRIACAVKAETGGAVLVSLGGDIAVEGAPPGGWPIHVCEDHKVAAGGQVVAIRDGALATSSTTVRRWTAGGIEIHHIVDPKTGAPAAVHWRTVSVTAATCVDANTAATAAIVLGARAVPWLSERELAARLVRLDGSIETVGGWPAQAEPESGESREQAAGHRESALHA